MVVSMDLNVSPLPEDEEESFDAHVQNYNGAEERHETAVEIAHREREERRKRMRVDRSDGRPVHASRQHDNNNDFSNMPYRTYDKSKIPPGWLDCPAAGQEIGGVLIPSKVPLGESFNDCVPPGKRYSSKQVIHRQRVAQRKLGLIIDLTNTTRYYLAAEFKKEGIKHVKIQCRGRGEAPENTAVNQFVYEVSEFVASQRHSKKYILVHCTHGHNRTGYMIVHYLMRTRPISVTEAINLFADARPPGIYKSDYIDALYAFYHERMPDKIVCPPTPEWKRSSELDLNGEAVPDDDDDGAPPPLHDNVETDVKMTIDDIIGDEIPDDQLGCRPALCYQLLNLHVGRKLQFPGSHPVSLTRRKLQLLRQRYYYATWKADGTRYMMLIMADGCYLIDRSFKFHRVQMRFPCSGTNEVLAEKTHHVTLLDGEMIIDTLPDSNKQERRYLIYDLMALNNVSVAERPFYERWKMIEKEVIEPRNYERQNIYQGRNPYYRYDLEPFRVRRKDFWLLSTVNKLLKEFIPKLSHDADGLIFQGWDDPYVSRTHEGLLKWKYSHMNSVDFLFQVGADGRQLLFLHERGQKRLMEGFSVIFEDEADPSSYSGKIIECAMDTEQRSWVFMRPRVDKDTPNEYNTYVKVKGSIDDNITEEVLLAEIKEITQLPMYADRIRNDSKPHQHMKSARRRSQGNGGHVKGRGVMLLLNILGERIITAADLVERIVRMISGRSPTDLGVVMVVILEI